eukprot:TRINITY_DN8576_c0_g1_i3.p1 TRINITY_DN8576_c0_g1~~TRINITY_DN8576_c0_g1_i3.p1  ORF type:complete len:409 (+),score=67.05 TRINITY_DN8576_c0_g1_i3:74-1300(+)
MASSNAGIVHHPKDGRDIFVQTAKHEQTSIEKVRKAIIVLVGFALTAVSSSCKDSSKHDGAVRQASTTLRKARVTQVILAGQIRIDFGDASGQSWPLQSRLSAKRFLKDLPRLIARYVHISTSAMGVILTDAIIASIELLHVRLDRQYQKLAKTMGRCAALKMALRKTKGYYNLNCIGSRLFKCSNNNIQPNSPLHTILVDALSRGVYCNVFKQMVYYEITGDTYATIDRASPAGLIAALVDDDDKPPTVSTSAHTDQGGQGSVPDVPQHDTNKLALGMSALPAHGSGIADMDWDNAVPSPVISNADIASPAADKEFAFMNAFQYPDDSIGDYSNISQALGEPLPAPSSSINADQLEDWSFKPFDLGMDVTNLPPIVDQEWLLAAKPSSEDFRGGFDFSVSHKYYRPL